MGLRRNKENKYLVCSILRDKRIELGITQKDAAKLSGISQTMVSRLEDGKYHSPSLHVIASLCFCYNLSIDRLVIQSILLNNK